METKTERRTISSVRRVLLALGILFVLAFGGFSIAKVAAKTAKIPLLLPPTLPLVDKGLDTTPSSVFIPVIENNAATTNTTGIASLYLPLMSRRAQIATRFGFGAASGSPGSFPEIDSLKAGWYLNWGVNKNPSQPNGMEYAQMIRIHQDLTCEIGSASAHNRTLCPYVIPHSYTYRPNAATIQEVAQARPGSLWLVGNEIERRDWPGGGHQDEILPELYAEAYYELYTLIKAADPLAKVAIGGVIQATPLRMQYLDRVLNHYQAKYGTKMPVDVWNIHTFILPEKTGYWGADIPVGLSETSGAYLFHLGPNGEVLSTMPEHIDLALIAQQIRDFRQWMKDRGEQEKPLIISEFSVLLPNWVLGLPDEDANSIINFMLGSFDHFLTAKDCNLGYSADGCRLIQRWVWYSLSDTSGFNEHQSLFNPSTKEMTATGRAARQFVQERMSELAKSPY